MATDQDPPPRPRRERPLVAPGRERPTPEARPEPPTVTTPPTGSRVFEPPVPEATEVRSDHVDMAFPGPAPQRRWTIALRAILLIPHLAWMYVLNIGLQFAVFIAWVAALFTKRVPDELASFIGKVIRYQTRVMAYGFFLLTDEYPPFGLAADHSIDLNVNPGEHNRAAVFFRLVLMIPSAIVAGLATAGASFIGVIGWLLALILGRLPTPLWEANAAVLRYTARTYAFGSLLTAEQPKGLFGDKEGAPTAPLPVDPSGMPDLPARPRLVRLVLSKAGRRIIVLYIVLAAVTYVGLFASGVVLGTRLSDAYNQLDDSYQELSADGDAWAQETQQCAFSGGQACLAAANTELADSFAEFVDEVSAIEFPANLGPEELLVYAQNCESALRAMAAATEASSYQQAGEAFQRAVEDFEDEYANFATDVEYES